MELIKVDNDNVAEVGTQEVRRVYGKAQLIARKAGLEAELANIVSMLALLE